MLPSLSWKPAAVHCRLPAGDGAAFNGLAFDGAAIDAFDSASFDGAALDAFDSAALGRRVRRRSV